MKNDAQFINLVTRQPVSQLMRHPNELTSQRAHQHITPARSSWLYQTALTFARFAPIFKPPSGGLVEAAFAVNVLFIDHAADFLAGANFYPRALPWNSRRLCLCFVIWKCFVFLSQGFNGTHKRLWVRT